VLDTLGAWEALEAPLEMPTESANSLDIRAWLQHWNVDSDESGNFIVCDGVVHFIEARPRVAFYCEACFWAASL
jgi:hypothetical protein